MYILWFIRLLIRHPKQFTTVWITHFTGRFHIFPKQFRVTEF